LLAVSAIEHPCVLKPAAQLEKAGLADATVCRSTPLGRVDRRLAEAMLAKPALLSVMLANNETGVVQDVRRWRAPPRRRWLVPYRCGAGFGQTGRRFPRLNAAGVHAMTLSAHKAYGPKGAAALVLDKRVELQPLIAGGGHERGLRSGTENVAAIVGFGVAAELAAQRVAELRRHVRWLQEKLESRSAGLGARIFARRRAFANTSYFAFPDIDGETLVGKLDREGFAVASGAACSSANPEPSHVLQGDGRGAGNGPRRGAGQPRRSQYRGGNRTIHQRLAGYSRTPAGTDSDGCLNNPT
jgi:cysteine desulfurase